MALSFSPPIDLCAFHPVSLSRLQLPAAEQRGPARRRLPHLPGGGDGADPAVRRDELFPSGAKTRLWEQGDGWWWWGGAGLMADVRMPSPPQSSEGGPSEGCGGSQRYPPSPPIMLQVTCPAPVNPNKTISRGRISAAGIKGLKDTKQYGL